MDWKIPLFKIYWDEEDIEMVADAIRRGMFWAIGHNIERFEEMLSEYIGTKYTVAFNSGTSALHAALLAHGLGQGDEVIVPPYTFLSSATSILMQNAIPIFADIEPKTNGLDPKALRHSITPLTKAVMVVHMNGYPADMNGLMAVAKEHDLTVIEDCSHAHGAEYKGRKVGTIGSLGVFSFQQKKNLSLGEGGMVITDDGDLAQKARAFSNFGDVPLGYNYRIDITSGRGFEYYTGLIFQLFTGGKKIGGGGRYDDLIPLMGGSDIPASGFALFLDRLMDMVKPEVLAGPPAQRVLVKTEAETVKEGFTIASRIREAGHVAELQLGEREPANIRWTLDVRSKAPVFVLTDRVNNGKSDISTAEEVIRILGEEGADKDSPA